jgi:hypothetical protein
MHQFAVWRVSNGSDSVIRRCPAQCPVCPKADIVSLPPPAFTECRHCGLASNIGLASKITSLYASRQRSGVRLPVVSRAHISRDIVTW